MEFTTHFKLQSQATRLDKGASCGEGRPRNRILTFSDTLFQGIWADDHPDGAFLDYNSARARTARRARGGGRADWRRELCPLHSPLL